MWIRSQDGKELVNVTRVSIIKPIGGKSISIFGYYGSSNALGEGAAIQLGKYDSMDEAKMVMDSLETWILNYPNKVYKMK